MERNKLRVVGGVFTDGPLFILEVIILSQSQMKGPYPPPSSHSAWAVDSRHCLVLESHPTSKC